MTADVRSSPRRGTFRSHAPRSACTGARTRDRRLRTAERVLHSVLRPVRRRLARARTERSGITAGQTHASGRNQHWGCIERTERGSPHSTASARKQRGMSKKRKEVEASVPARIRELGFGCPHVDCMLQKSVGDVWSRISSANALQKERSGSSERGPSTERRSAGQTVGGRAGRKDHRASEPPAQVGRGSAQGPGWRESAIQRSLHRSRAVQRSWDRGCNGHRIPGRVSCRTKALRIIIETSRSREASTDGLGVPAHSPTRAPRPKAEGPVTGSPREGGGGVRVTRGRDRSVRGSIAVGAVGRKRPRS